MSNSLFKCREPTCHNEDKYIEQGTDFKYIFTNPTTNKKTTGLTYKQAVELYKRFNLVNKEVMAAKTIKNAYRRHRRHNTTNQLLRMHKKGMLKGIKYSVIPHIKQYTKKMNHSNYFVDNPPHSRKNVRGQMTMLASEPITLENLLRMHGSVARPVARPVAVPVHRVQPLHSASRSASRSRGRSASRSRGRSASRSRGRSASRSRGRPAARSASRSASRSPPALTNNDLYS